MRRSRREWAASLLARPAIAPIARMLPRWRGVIVLNYHRIGNGAGQPWDRTLWNVDAEEFDRQLEVLSRDAEVLTPENVVGLAGEATPGRRVLLTFDDGYRDNYEIAYPLLRRHGLTATFFPATAFLDGGRIAWWDELAWIVHRATCATLPAGPWSPTPLPLGPDQQHTTSVLVGYYKGLASLDAEMFVEQVAEASGAGRCPPAEYESLWMTWDMVRELRLGGMAIGGHTATHPILARLTVAEQENEISEGARRLASELGSPMRWFAYPVGSRASFTAATQQILRDHGIELAFSFHGGFASFARLDPLDVPRVHVSSAHRPELLQAMLVLPRLFCRW
jgi:peptidoglycan/xylan/chitin deacetylase (PgdA/CDA1 family)